MKQLTIVILLVLSVQVSAQTHFFLEANGNMSLISGIESVEVTKLKSKLKDFDLLQYDIFSSEYKSKFSGGIAGGLQYFINPEISVEIALDLSGPRFHQNLDHTVAEKYIPIASTEESPTTKPEVTNTITDTYALLLLSMPISVSYHTLENTLSAGVGLVPATVAPLAGGTEKTRNFNPLALGIQIHLRYKFIENMWLTTTFQEFSTKLYKPEERLSFSSNRLVKIGLRYDL